MATAPEKSAQAIGKRIRRLRAERGLTQEAFASRLLDFLRRSDPRSKLSRGAVGNWELGKGIKRENLAAIAACFDVEMDWLATGRGSDASPSPVRPAPSVYSGGTRAIEAGDIPQIGDHLGMGLSTEAQTIQVPLGNGSVAAVPVVATWKVPAAVLGGRSNASLSAVHIVPCRGGSMAPRIMDGDYVFIDTSERIPSPPGIFALWDGQGQTLKHVELIPNTEPPRVRIAAENPSYGTYERTVDEVNIIGRYLCRLTTE